MDNNPVDLSVVLLTYNSRPHLQPCFAALQAELPAATSAHEVVVVDNGSQDGSAEWVAAHPLTSRLIRNDRNRGVGPARNQGIRASSGTYVLSLDIDTQVQAGCLTELLAAGRARPEAGLIGPQLVGLDRQRQLTARRFPTVCSKLLRQQRDNHRRGYLAAENYLNWTPQAPRAVDYVIGAAQFMRRATLDAVGLFDERIFYGPEDVDLCLRMWQTGWQVLYWPAAVIVHAEQRMTRSWRGLLSASGRGHLGGLIWYFWKHRYLWQRPRVRITTLARPAKARGN